ncbi:hypothetical protein CWE09_10055 [Aliidiomarina minuta]|uniref:Glycosyltransferase 2-like domain-containing protein n=1 Tax=Aliidiomarina minuta TaxID=880057 RepID=A0A432WAE3_9GAMM|nr:glycosyltransferase family 2 protein [Aliidiomarina minuta]RUO27011.1 hypothetical protein CWE09_10055 [Aliidiomarina minuta]
MSISVVLPVYNMAPWLETCMESLNQQTDSDFEVIFVNDASKDKSLSLLSDFENQYENVTVIDLSVNVGTFHARREGVMKSQRGHVLFLDPDDSLDKKAIETLKSVINKSGADFIVYDVEDSGKPPNKQPLAFAHNKLNKNKNTVLDFYLKEVNRSVWGTPGKLISRSVLVNSYEELSFIKSRLCSSEDVLLNIVSVGLSKSLEYLRRPLYRYFRRPGSASRTVDLGKIRENFEQKGTVINSLNHIKCKWEKESSTTDYSELELTILELRLKSLMGVRKHLPLPSMSLSYQECLKESYAQKPDLKKLVFMAAHRLSFSSIRL